MTLADSRSQGLPRCLREEEAASDPMEQFRRWFAEARQAGLPRYEAMTLATVAPDGQPSARVVLLRGLDERGFTFFTNYESRKGSELAVNPRAALVFYWEGLDRQVCIEGRVERISPADSDAYFLSRPLGHRLGAWASPQSQVIPHREALEARMMEVTARFQGQEVPRPPHWGGFRVAPETVEFWQGQSNRLHDRLRYRRQQDGGWLRERLAP